MPPHCAIATIACMEAAASCFRLRPCCIGAFDITVVSHGLPCGSATHAPCRHFLAFPFPTARFPHQPRRMVFVTDLLYAGGAAAAAWQSLGQWYRFKAGTEKRFDDRRTLADFEAYLKESKAKGERTAEAPGAGLASQAHLLAGWKVLTPAQKIGLAEVRCCCCHSFVCRNNQTVIWFDHG